MKPLTAELSRRLQEQILNPDGLDSYFEYITMSLGYALTIYDVNGFTLRDAALRSSFEPYVMHTHPFCSMVKKTHRNKLRCTLNRKYSVRKAATEQRAFYGKCYMGIEEVVFPVVHGGDTIAVVFLGQFSTRSPEDRELIKSKAERYQVNSEVLQDIYNKIALTMDEAMIEELLGVASTISQLIVFSFQATLLSAQMNRNIGLSYADNNLSREQAIAKLAMELVQNTYHEPFDLDSVAKHCNCSSSYVSRCFSQVFGMPLVKYVNQIRIQHAKSLLGATTLSIKEIALSLGFNDTNYFSKVFRSIEGTSPLDYRKRRG